MKAFRTLTRFISFLRPHVRRLWGLALLVLVVRVITLPVPLCYRAIVDDAIPRRDLGSLSVWIAALAGLLLGARLLEFLLHVASIGLQQHVLHDVRLALYRHLQKLDLTFFRRHATGGLLSRIMSDVTQVQSVLSHELFEVFASTLQLAIVGALLLWLNPGLALLSALAFPALVVLAALFQQRLFRISKAIQERREELSARIQENLGGMSLIQALAIERERLEATRRKSDELRTTVVRSERIGAGVNLLTFSLTDLPLSLFVWGYGGYQVIQGDLSLGGLIAFHQYLLMLYDPVIRIFRFNVRLQVARAAIHRVYEVLDARPSIVDAVDARPLHVESGHLRIEDVTLGYQDDRPPVVHSLTLDVAPGEVLGVVGPSGAGKSTLARSLLRFVEPRSGRILIDGQDVRSVTLESLRRQVGLVDQEVFIFSDTLRANISLARPDSRGEAVALAARAAGAEEFIQALQDGYETVVGERGLDLSGGERQRLALARVILQDPRILVFDEALSAVDTRSERIIQEALAQIVRGKTAIVIAHRFSTLRLCHRIAVLSEGQLVELGTHAELAARDGLYSALLRAQALEGRAP